MAEGRTAIGVEGLGGFGVSLVAAALAALGAPKVLWVIVLVLGVGLIVLAVVQWWRSSHPSAGDPAEGQGPPEADEIAILSQWLDSGLEARDDLEFAYKGFELRKHPPFTAEATESAFQAILEMRKQAFLWVVESDLAVREAFGDHVARMFRAHPNVALTRSRPPELHDLDLQLWEDVACRVEWLAIRLQALGGG